MSWGIIILLKLIYFTERVIIMDKKKLLKEITNWRHYLHKNPEIAFEEENTAKFIRDKLLKMGYEVETGIGGNGVVSTLSVGDSEKIIAIRADMDALKITEKSELPYKSQKKDEMHACGHDGHIATALGAAKILAENKNFNGTVRFIFQPAEEPGEGAQAMIDDGLFERFPIDEFYALHNMPQLPAGEIHSKPGAIMASEDNFKIHIEGKGGHASAPNLGIDPLVIASETILALQTIISRNINPIDSAVISCTEIYTDGLRNVIPSNVTISGDTRSYSFEVQKIIKKRMEKICINICSAYNAKCNFKYSNSFSPTINWEKCHNTAVKAATNILGKSKVIADTDPMMSSEDFGKFLEKVPGCLVFLGGKTDNNYPLHHSSYDYLDDNLIRGAEFFAEIVKIKLPIE